ncbi:MAG: UDP-N-acetylmuramoyl-tripeptide--D-alanyl-D-alanine ligase [Bacteroidetes bacterium]|nr:UDP-N-acetylmuramoyl-tripeptide--D-alanyl-D-alanine ligase [Bacteroidota bacterium]
MRRGFIYMDNKINEIYPLFLEHPAVSTDSRKVTPGSIFFALRGESFNGNEFAIQALESGAEYAVVDEAIYAGNKSCILVEDVLSTLQALSNHHRMQFKIPLIAITGTNGKTTTKELALWVLSKKYNTLATKGNLNNHIGVPLTLLNLNHNTEMAIIEMGANHQGEIDFLCNIAQPDYGLITNIGKAHLEGFGSFEGVVRTKTELYHFIGKHDGILFVNNDDTLLKDHCLTHRQVTYGGYPANIAATNISADPFVSMDIHIPDHESFRIESKLYGLYNAGNILAAACIGWYFNVPASDIKSALEEYQPGNNRSQLVKTDHNLLILDAYNANPGSMNAAIRNFAASGYPEKTVILGDMLELGKDTDPEHIEILNSVDQLKFAHIYLVGPTFTRLNTKRENICFQDSDLAKLYLEHHKIENATLLIKGSRGIRLEKLLDVL